MFYLSRTHQNLSNQAKTHMEVHFLPIEPIGMLKNSNEPNKVLEKEDELIILSKEEDELNKTTKETKTPNRIARQVLKLVYGI